MLQDRLCKCFDTRQLYNYSALKYFLLLLLGDVSVGIKCDANVISEEEQDIDFAIIPNANDTFTVKYMPPAAGRYTVKVLFAGEVCILMVLAGS